MPALKEDQVFVKHFLRRFPIAILFRPLKVLQEIVQVILGMRVKVLDPRLNASLINLSLETL